MVREIGDDVLENEVTGNEGSVLLLVYATWCGDCQRILPVLDKFSTLPEYNRVSFLQLNVDKNPQAKMHLDVQAVSDPLSVPGRPQNSRTDSRSAG